LFVLPSSPSFVSLVISDPDELDAVYSNGDVITASFDIPTSRPFAATKEDLLNLFTFSQSIGNDFTGSWDSASVLKITIVDVGDETIIGFFNIEGEGSEFVSFPESVDIPPGDPVFVDVTVTIPSDYPNDVYLSPFITAIERADQEQTVRISLAEQTVRISLAIRQHLEIKIGNPIIPEVTAQLEPEKVTTPESEQEETLQEETKEPGSFTITQSEEEEGGGCLISTATFGSELAPQVQMLREIRDNKLLSTESGSTFMAGFNTLYYSFSPTIADLERQSPIFREVVHIAITPLITSLSILNYIDMDSEAEVLVYGISLIMLNVGMYFVAPAILITRLRR